MAINSDSDSDSDTEISFTPPRRGPIIVSSDSEGDSESERPPRHLRAPSRTPSWAKSVSRSPSPIVRRRVKTSRSVSPGLERWADGSEQGYESADSGRIRLRRERSPSILREGESDSESVGEVEVSSESDADSDESGAEDSEDESHRPKAEFTTQEQLLSGNITNVRRVQEGRQGSPEQDLQPVAESQAEESGDDQEALGSDPEDNMEVEPASEADSEAEDSSEGESEAEVEAGSEAEAEFEAGATSEAEYGSEIEAKAEAEAVSEGEAEPREEFESEAGVESEAEFGSEAEAEAEVEAEFGIENRAKPLNESESEGEAAPGPEDEDGDEAEFADESQPETQPIHEPLPSSHSHPKNTINTRPATPSPSNDSSKTEEGSASFLSLDGKPIAPPDSPSPSEHSELPTAFESDRSDSAFPDLDEDREEEEESGEIPHTNTMTTSRSLARKRPRESPRVPGRTRGKQIDRHNLNYLELLNDHIQLAASRGLSECKHDRDRKTPVLGSLWTRLERDIFFKYLPIVGKDNVPELSRLIGTKSVIECRAYVKALQDGREHDWHAPAKRWIRDKELISSRDIPAAVELSDECVKALEEEADALEERTRKEEERREKCKWGDLWRLDSESSWTIEELYKKDNIEEIIQIAPEAELLNIHNMLMLSESIFMNGSRDDSNWRSLGSDPPAIRYMAFKDLHTLVVSLTRRIVQTTIYMATSRLRGMESKVFRQSENIRPIDVEAAVNCLRLPENSREYWMKIPRRTGLHVYSRKEDILKKSNRNLVPYDQVEQVLKCTRSHGSGSGVKPDAFGDEDDDDTMEAKMDALLAATYVDRGENEDQGAFDPMDTEFSGLDFKNGIDDSDDDENLKSEESDVDVDGTLKSKPQKITDARLEAIDKAEDIFMEVLDKKKSYKEEKALWKLMGREPINPLPNLKKPLPDLHSLERKRPLELLNWRDSAGYIAPWETKKRRKTEQLYTGIWADDEESSNAFYSSAESQTTTIVHKHDVVAKKEAPKKRKHERIKGPVKAVSPPAQRPRRVRERRRPKMYADFVSTIDNISESDEEALALELQEDDSLSEAGVD